MERRLLGSKKLCDAENVGNENWDVEGNTWGSGALKEKVPVPNLVAAYGNLRICHDKKFLHISVDVQLELDTDLSLRYN